MLDKGIFIAENGNKFETFLNDLPQERMSKEAEHSEIRFEGGLLRKVNINAGGFYLRNLKIIPEEFYIIFSNSATIKVDGENHKILLLPEQYLILNESEEANYRFFINHAEETGEIFFIRLSKFKFRTFPESIALNDRMTTDAEVINIINDIFSCCYEIPLKTSYAEAKVIELLCVFEHQIKNLNNSIQVAQVPNHMLEPIYLARKIMTDNLKDPLSLAGLARAIGTNENYLKKYFKIVFGRTVFSFLNDYKMQVAKRMLVKQKLQINQVAADLGFKNSSNFTANFYKYYGFLPKKFKAGKLSLFVFTEDFFMLFEEFGILFGM